MICRISIFENWKIVFFEKLRDFRMIDFVGLYLSYFDSGLIINRQKFAPDTEQQNDQISLWYVNICCLCSPSKLRGQISKFSWEATLHGSRLGCEVTVASIFCTLVVSTVEYTLVPFKSSLFARKLATGPIQWMLSDFGHFSSTEHIILLECSLGLKLGTSRQ